MTPLRRYCVCAIASLFSLTVPFVVAAKNMPSGQSVFLREVLVDTVDGENWLRFRFVAPSINKGMGGVAYDSAFEDIQHLCTEIVVPYIAEYDLKSDLVVVSIADQKNEFGETNPETTQFFEAFRVKNNICIWEAL